MEGEGEGAFIVGLGNGVVVDVAGGATRSSNLCSGRITEALFNPFQAIKS
jgi:hypothetical protein